MPPKSKESKAAPADSASYEIRDTVLAKVRGYPAWPGIIVDPDNVSKAVLKERPGAKKAKFYCVRFFPTGDHAWVTPKDISKLQQHEIEAYINEPSKKNGDLLKGYKIALDPSEWEEKMAAGVAAAEEAEAAMEVDQLDSDGGGGSTKGKAAAKKRKREPAEKKAPAPRAKKEPAEKKKAPSAAGSKRAPKKSKEAVESEDEAGEDKPSKKAKTNGPTDDSSEKVKGWRHKLQKSFLTKDKPITADDMPDMDKLFTTIETYNMTFENLSFSKIGKVMRHIAKLDDSALPRNSEFNFLSRAQTLVDKWAALASSQDKTNGDAEPGDLTVMEPAGADADGEGEPADDAKDKDADGEPASAGASADADGDTKMDEA